MPAQEKKMLAAMKKNDKEMVKICECVCGDLGYRVEANLLLAACGRRNKRHSRQEPSYQFYAALI